MANNMLSNLYKGNTPVANSKDMRPQSYPGTPKRRDSDTDSIQLGNVSIDISSDVEEAAARKIRAEKRKAHEQANSLEPSVPTNKVVITQQNQSRL